MNLFFLIISTTLSGLLLDPPSVPETNLPHELPGLHNLMRLSADVYSGSEPDGEDAFENLKKLGIRTIVSVDGATPKVAMAKRFGIQYVHIPFGYDAVPQSAQLALTRVAKESRTPVYIHCHHGKHRGPAAVAIVCRAKGITDAAGGLLILQKAGTSRDYAGLWRDVEEYTIPPDNAELPELVEVAVVETLPAAMARIDRTFDNLKLSATQDWKVPAQHPDLVAVQEALQLQESFHEVNRLLPKDKYANNFRRWLAESDSMASKLRAALKSNDTALASATLTSLQKSCQQCHAKYRDH